MQHIKVQSTNVESVGYDEKRGLMEVKFTNGSHYEYQGVPKETFHEMMKAASKGKFLGSKVKGVHKYRRVDQI